MNGKQMEHVFQLIDRNMQLSSEEVTEYIRDHQQAIAESLVRTGTATVHTQGGDFQIRVADLEAAAA